MGNVFIRSSANRRPCDRWIVDSLEATKDRGWYWSMRSHICGVSLHFCNGRNCRSERGRHRDPFRKTSHRSDGAAHYRFCVGLRRSETASLSRIRRENREHRSRNAEWRNGCIARQRAFPSTPIGSGSHGLQRSDPKYHGWTDRCILEASSNRRNSGRR